MATSPDGRFLRPRPAIPIKGDPDADPPILESEIPAVRALLCGSSAVAQPLQKYNSEAHKLLAALTKDRAILDSLDASLPRATVHRAMRAALCQASVQRQTLIAKLQKGHPAPMAGQQRWFLKATLEKRRGRFTKDGGDYCPVGWQQDKELLLCPSDPSLRRMVKVGRELYVVHNDDAMEELLSCAQYYLGGGSQPLPDDLPSRLEKMEAISIPDSALECKGFCPVTFKDGPSKDQPIQAACLKPTKDSPEEARSFVCKYKGTLFRLLDAKKQERFMRTPHLFAALKMPIKLPPDALPVVLDKLPLPGYLQHTVVDAISEGLLALGQAAPRFPGVDNRESATKFLALYLRSRNAGNSPVDARLHGQNLARFRKACELLVRGAVGRDLPKAVLPGSEVVEEFMARHAEGPRAVVAD